MKRSRSVFGPEMHSLHSDFEDVGMGGAIARLLGALHQRVGAVEVPAWVWSLDYAFAVTECARCDGVTALVAHLRGVRRVLLNEQGGAGEDGEPSPLPPLARTATQTAAIVRMCFGEVLEAIAVCVARSVVADEVAPGPGVDAAWLSCVYYDSYCAAVWTSAHAEYVATIQDLLAGRSPTEELVRDMMVPAPDLYTVACAGHLAHLGTLLERTASPRCCSKTSQSLLSILTRVTNAGSRGWETTLLAALKESEGAVRVCMQCLAVALGGLNPAIHPAARRPWRERFATLRALRLQTHQDFKDVISKAPSAVKEAIRMHLAAVFAADCATLEAMRQTRQPAGQLRMPPIGMPHPSLAAAMHRMADAGACMIVSRVSAAEAIHKHLVSEPRSRKKPEARTSRSVKHEPEALAYSSSWLGGRSGPSGLALRPAVHVVSGLLSASYRSIFIPFWLHGNHHGHRASRLDSAQYAALHDRSPAHRMCALLSTEQFQLAERLAIDNADASLLTVAQACKLLGIVQGAGSAPGLPCSASSRAMQEAQVDVMNLGAHDAALLMAFSRIATLRSVMLSYDLGETTRQKQARAVCQRLLLDLAPDEDPCVAVQTRLPKHATVLYCCSECRRVVNSVQDNSGKEQPFNELGLAASMLTIDNGACCGHMRCAKRSSAALRTAVALEAAADQLKLERFEPAASPLLPRDLRPATIVSTMCKGTKRKAATMRDSSSEVAKFRRDLKSCFEQSRRATSCGDVPLVCVPILGRAVRIFGGWYALCSMCGTLARVLPTSRFRDEICCMRCDFSMLAGKEAATEMHAALPKPPPPACRFCGKVEPENGAGMKWRRVEAPADTGGRNACVPPPLRTVHYCPSHYRSWLVHAHKILPTAKIFSHLVNKARPILGAEAAAIGHGGRARRGAADAGTSAGTSGDADDADDADALLPVPARRKAAHGKRRSRLERAITKQSRQRRQQHH